MPEPKDTVTTSNFKGFTNTKCEFFPCHKDVEPSNFNCLYCYCPLAFLECPGPYEVLTYGGVKRKDCSKCTLPHDGIEKSWNFIQLWLDKPIPWSGLPADPKTANKLRKRHSGTL